MTGHQQVGSVDDPDDGRTERGRLRILLGAAPGVGKTYVMLREGWLDKQRGIDVVIGVVDPRGREKTAEQVRGLEQVPLTGVQDDGSTVEEMDVDAVLVREPGLCLVDDIAHTNPAGSRHAARWQDVEELLEAGIDVLATLNIQHLESLNDVIERITGVRERETIPDRFVRDADEIQLVDVTPEELRRRLSHGDLFPAEQVDAATGDLFRPGTLRALRELALMWLADRVDEELHDHLAGQGTNESWETRERVVVALSGAPGADMVVRRAARIASRVRGELIGVHVRTQDTVESTEPRYLERDRNLARQMGGKYREVADDDVADALLAVARSEQATQVVVGSSRRSRWQELTRGSIVRDVVRGSAGIDVHVISHQQTASGASLSRPRNLSGVGPRRRTAGYLVGVIGLVVLTVVFTGFEHGLALSSVLLLYLAVIVGATAIGGAGPALVTTVGAFALADFFFTEPFHTFVIDSPTVIVELIVFASIASVVSWLVSNAARRRAQADRATAEARTLSALATTLLDSDDPLPELVEDLVTTFELDSAALLRETTDGWHIEAAAGHPLPRAPSQGTDRIDLSGGYVLVLNGQGTLGEDRRVLTAFTAQLALGLATRQLREQAAAAEEDARVNELRASLLSAVSHDLRTPLSSIKASASSLLSDDVTWQRDAVEQFATAIVEEADRLNGLVGNLLDMSRLHAGDLRLELGPTPVDEAIPNTLKGLPAAAATQVDVGALHELPPVIGDPVLIERIVANLIDNALRWSPSDQPVLVRGSTNAGRVQLRVIDRGPGIPQNDRERVFQPFQRRTDSSDDRGVGLGLAVARGFARAMQGELWVEDTPGGGTTMVLELTQAEQPA